METSTPPLSPIRNYVTPLETAPTYHEQLRRRTSSFSSGHSRSPTTPRHHRFSNASQFSDGMPTPHDEAPAHGGMGNLADELDQLDDDYEEEDATEATIDGQREDEDDKEPRDSGIDVSYNSGKKATSPHVRNFSKPFGIAEKPPDEEEAEREDKLSPDLEDAITNIARMTSYTSTPEDPLIPRLMVLLQDLGNQTSLEQSTQRLTTSINSLTAHLTAQTKELQRMSTSLLSPFLAFSAPIDPALVEETVPLVDALLKELPLPDTAPLQGLQKLGRQTTDVIQTLSHLTDTLQMGKQITNTAARHLRTTQTMVAELRRERERAEIARHELSKSDMEEQLRQRKCASECKDVVAGFEATCDALRETLAQQVAVAA
jgi:hypothetical protein